MSQTPDTIVHLLRHGEVHNPDGVLYGRRPGFHLSDLGRQMARAGRRRPSATATSRTCGSSPLERAQETAQPLADARGLEIVTDDRVIESTQRVRGQAVRRRRRRVLRKPSPWRHLWNPLRPSWGEPYKEVAARMLAAVHDARDAAAGPRGRDRLPPAADLDRPGCTRERRSLRARPAQAAVHAVLAHVVPLRRRPARPVAYSEPAGDLIPPADKNAPFSAGGAPEEQRP